MSLYTFCCLKSNDTSQLLIDFFFWELFALKLKFPNPGVEGTPDKYHTIRIYVISRKDP